MCGVTIACDGAWPTRRNNPVGHTVGRLVRTTWGGPRDIAASGLRDPLSEATGLAAMPAIGQVEYLTTDGAKSERPHANFSKHAKMMEPESCVVMAVMLLLLGFHVDGLLADGDSGLRNARNGLPQEHMPTVHLCMNHWFRSFRDLSLIHI